MIGDGWRRKRTGSVVLYSFVSWEMDDGMKSIWNVTTNSFFWLWLGQKYALLLFTEKGLRASIVSQPGLQEIAPWRRAIGERYLCGESLVAEQKGVRLSAQNLLVFFLRIKVVYISCDSWGKDWGWISIPSLNAEATGFLWVVIVFWFCYCITSGTPSHSVSALGVGRWALGDGRWALGVGRWAKTGNGR